MSRYTTVGTFDKYVFQSLRLSFPCDVLPNNRIVVIFTVYLDASGKPDDPNIRDFVLAGYVSTQDQWTSFEVEWRSALADFGIPFFHMTDYSAKKTFYKQWTESEREIRYERLVNIINAHTVCSIGITISRIDYAAAMGSIAPTMPSGIYGYAFGIFPLAVSMLLAKKGYVEPHIAYVLDRERGLGAYISLIDEVVTHLDRVAHAPGRQLNPLGYLSAKTEDKQRFVPLQAADILAYQLYRDGAKYHRQFKDGRLSKHLGMLRTKDSHWERWTESEIRYTMQSSRTIREGLLGRMLK
jgi:hypothetical protein